MTYDLHGPWSLSSDPGTLPHALLSFPSVLAKDKSKYSINYGGEDVINMVLGFGMPANKLQIGIASYGLGFAGVSPGTMVNYPGLDQPWTAPSHFDKTVTAQDGNVPYKSIVALINQGYTMYNIQDGSAQTIGSYIYSDKAKQFVGYESPDEIQSVCQFVKHKNLAGAFVWSMDSDSQDNAPGQPDSSLIADFHADCQ